MLECLKYYHCTNTADTFCLHLQEINNLKFKNITDDTHRFSAIRC